MPQPAAQRSASATAARTAAEIQATQIAVAAAPAPEVSPEAVKLAAGSIMATFIAFLAALREQHNRALAEQLGRFSSSRDDIAQVAVDEMRLEQEFARNSADRVASALPQALAIADPVQREARVRQILADEERYAQQRGEAMFARALAALTRSQLRRDSPLGAFWKLGAAHKHTEGCRFMAGKFWPWSVLDRVHPPRHYGCTSTLHGYGEAILAGWMSPSDVPDEAEAIRAASGVVMESDDAESLLRALQEGHEDGATYEISLTA